MNEPAPPSTSPDWYERNIEPEVRELVRYLRNHGVNTECSCGHELYVQCQLIPSGQLYEIYAAVYAWYAEQGKRIDFRLEARAEVLDGHPYWSLDILLPWPDVYPPEEWVKRYGIPGEVCKRCHRGVVIGFKVDDEVWRAVTRQRWPILCPQCFDELAHVANIQYSFLELFPISWSEWEETK